LLNFNISVQHYIWLRTKSFTLVLVTDDLYKHYAITISISKLFVLPMQYNKSKIKKVFILTFRLAFSPGFLLKSGETSK